MGHLIFEEWKKKKNSSFAKYFLFIPDERFCSCIVYQMYKMWKVILCLSGWLFVKLITQFEWKSRPRSYIYNTNFKMWSHKPIQTWSSLNELSENKKDCYKACIVTYQILHWIKTSKQFLIMGRGLRSSDPCPSMCHQNQASKCQYF